MFSRHLYTCIHANMAADMLSILVCVLTLHFGWHQLTEGDIEGFVSMSLELIFAPLAIRCYEMKFSLTFSHPSVQPVSVVGVGGGGNQVSPI